MTPPLPQPPHLFSLWPGPERSPAGGGRHRASAPPHRRQAAKPAADSQPHRDMAGCRLLGLLLAFSALLGAGHGDKLDDFDLEDALYDHTTKRPTPMGPRKPAGDTAGFDLADYFDTIPETTTKPAKPTPKPFPRPGKPDNSFWDVIHTTTKQPKTTRPPPKHNPAKNPMDFDLADALDDKNDGKDARRQSIRPDEGFSDDDLASIVDGGYSPDKKKGSGGKTDDYSGSAVTDTGTIAGIASGLAMALVGAVTSYISYQQKKFCFSIQQGLNSEYVKGENMEAVVSEEPQVKYSVLETQSAEPPKHDSAKM